LSRSEKAPAARPLDEKDELYVADVRKLAATEGPYRLGEANIEGYPALHFLKNEGLPVSDAPRLNAEKPFSISVNFLFPKAEQSYTVAAQQNAKDKNRGWAIEVGSRVTLLRLVGDGGRNIEIRAGHLEQIKHGTWNTVTVAYDGSRHQSGLSMYLNGRAIPTQGGGNTNLELSGEIAVDSPMLLGRALSRTCESSTAC
jgi:hypothetical protein